MLYSGPVAGVDDSVKVTRSLEVRALGLKCRVKNVVRFEGARDQELSTQPRSDRTPKKVSARTRTAALRNRAIERGGRSEDATSETTAELRPVLRIYSPEPSTSNRAFCTAQGLIERSAPQRHP